MSTPNQAASKAAALAAQIALTAAANTVFIDNATVIIADLVSQGKYHVYLSHVKHVSFKDIQTYFQGLNYIVQVPHCPSWQGWLWDEWFHKFCSDRQICQCNKPCRILISWKNPFLP